MRPRRTKLNPAEQALRPKLQHLTFSAAEIEWLLAHLPADTPTLLVQQLHSKLIELQESRQTTSPREQ